MTIRKRYLELFFVDKATDERQPFSTFKGIDLNQVVYGRQFGGINVLVTSEISLRKK